MATIAFFADRHKTISDFDKYDIGDCNIFVGFDKYFNCKIKIGGCWQKTVSVFDKCCFGDKKMTGNNIIIDNSGGKYCHRTK